MHAVVERPVDDVRVAGHPADVGGAPPDRVVVDVEDPLVRDGDVEEVAGCRVQRALRLRRRARGVEEEERVLRVHALRLARRPARPRRGRATRRRAPRSRAPVAGAAENDESFDGRRGLGGNVRVHLQRHLSALAPALVLRDQDLALRSREAARRASPTRSRRRRRCAARRCARTRASRSEARAPSPCRCRRDPPCGLRASAARSRAGTPRPAGRRR